MANPNIDISQVYGGGGNAGATYTNDYIELYNYGTTDVSVSGWSVQYASATGTSWQVTTLTGTIQAGHYYLIQEAKGAGGSTALPTPDATGTISMSGTAGKVALSTSTTAFSGSTPTGAVDFVGFGTANAFEGTGAAPAPSNTTADIRTPSGTDTNDNSKDFKTGAAMPRNTSITGVTQPTGTTITIGDAAAIRAADGTATETFTVTRSDTTGAFSFNYATADNSAKAGTDYTAEQGTLSFAAGGPASQTITVPVTPDANAPTSSNFALNLSNLVSTTGSASLSKTSATGTIISNPTPIYTIQGTGFTSPLAGQSVTTDGIVTAVSGTGYYLQDAKGDGDAATSDGVFVYTASTPTVAVGDLLATSGKVQEYTASTASGAFSTTEISGITATNVVSHNNALPAAVLIGPDGVQPPTSDLAAGNALYESLEGMRVTVENPQAVGPTNEFGEIETVAGDGAGATGLNGNGDLLITEGQPSFGNTDSTGGDFNPERIKIDSALVPNAVPKADVGTQFTNTTGILNYAFDQFGVSATSALSVSKVSTITPTIGTLTGDATHLTFGSYNIENFTATTGVAGQGPAKAATVAGQIVNNLKSPDIIALQEVQDNSGPTDGDTITSASANLKALTDAISAAGGPQYTAIDNPFIGVDTNGGEPGGNIRTAYLYNPARVSFVPGSLATVSANGTVITDQGSASADAAANSDQQTNPQNPFYASRPPLSAQFTFNGQTVTVVDNHFTSKGGSGDLMGSVQPAFDGGEVQRAGQAQAVNNYVDSLLSSNPAANIIVTGDLNEFNEEEPINVLQGTASISGYMVNGASASTSASATYTPGGTAVLTDLESTLPADQRYDYNFEGNAESLVHTLASTSLSPGAQLQVIHINSEYANQTSDHDPLLASFAIAPVCFAAGTLILTARGQIAIEALRPDDLVATASGTLRPVRWLDHRAVDCRRHPRPHEAQTVRIAAHAFAPGKPARDLRVSPGHLLCVDVGGEVLIPAASLINGTTIVQEDVDRVAYWHVELDSHDILLAENMPCESYLDTGNRSFFAANGMERPDATPGTHADFCRPFHYRGPTVEAARADLAARAESLGWRPDRDAGLHLLVDGERVDPLGEGDTAIFLFPSNARDVRLVSKTFVPATLGGKDMRTLGLRISGLCLAGSGGVPRRVDLDDPALAAAFHDSERVNARSWRWTVAEATPLPPTLWSGLTGMVALHLTHTASTVRGYDRAAPLALVAAAEMRKVG